MLSYWLSCLKPKSLILPEKRHFMPSVWCTDAVSPAHPSLWRIAKIPFSQLLILYINLFEILTVFSWVACIVVLGYGYFVPCSENLKWGCFGLNIPQKGKNVKITKWKRWTATAFMANVFPEYFRKCGLDPYWWKVEILHMKMAFSQFHP